MAPSRVVVDGLEQAVSKVLLSPDANGERQVVVKSLSAKDVGAFLEVISAVKLEDPTWKLANESAVEGMRRAANILHLLDEQLLPLLPGHTSDPRVLERFFAISLKLSAQAFVAGGTFFDAVLKVGDGIDSLVARLRDEQPSQKMSEYKDILEDIAQIGKDVKAALEGTFTVSESEV